MADAVCIIPARGGSKRIPRKNVKAFCGKPMICWSIEAARASGLFTDIIVSTDDEEIAVIARDAGGTTPFMRDAALADDHTGTQPVIADAIHKLGLADDVPVCCLYPTAPFVTADRLRDGRAQLADAPGFVMTVTEFSFPVQRGLLLTDQGLTPREPQHIKARSQDLDPVYHDAGQFYWARAARWCDDEQAIWDGARPVLLPPWQVQDIDPPTDWRPAGVEMTALADPPGRGWRACFAAVIQP